MRNTHVSLWHLGNSKLFLSFPEGIKNANQKKLQWPQTHYLPAPQSIGTGKKIQEKIIQARLFQEEDLFVVCSPALSTAISQTIKGSGRVWAWQGCGGPGVAGIHGSPVSHTQWPAAWSHQSLYLHFPLWETWSDRYSACPPSSCLMFC